MTTFFMIIAWLIGLASLLFVSQATSGVAGICFACLIVITARVAQADEHHKALLQQLSRPDTRPVGR